MKRVFVGACALLALLAASPARAHVTIQPNEAIASSFSRFVVRVPNEDARRATIKVEVEFPPLAFVSFEPKEGWKRTVENTTLDEPIEAFGSEIDEVVGTVTWSGGSIEPGEFDEFGFSAAMPEGKQTLEFKAIQTYEGGKVVEWTGPVDSEEPAPLLKTYDIGAKEGEGELAVLARLADDIAAATATTEEQPETSSSDADADALPLILAGAALLLSAMALAAALRKRVPDRRVT